MVRLAGGRLALLGGVNGCNLGEAWTWSRGYGWRQVAVPSQAQSILAVSSGVAVSGLFSREVWATSGGRLVWLGFGQASSWHAATLASASGTGVVTFSTPHQ